MRRTAFTIFAASLAIPLALGGCKKDKNEDQDTSVDTDADAPGDTAGDTAEDTPADTPADTADDTAGDPAADTSDEDAAGDTATDTAGDTAGDTATDAVDEDGASPCDTDLGTWTPGVTEAGVLVGDNWWAIDGSISSDLTTEPVSLIEIESYGDSGGPMAVGTTTITSFVDYATCGLCITVYEGCTMSGGCTRMYMAEQATLEITAFGFSAGGDLTGTATGLYLSEYDESTDTLVPGGVSMCVDVWAFDETFVDWT